MTHRHNTRTPWGRHEHRKPIRTLETAIYERPMTRFTPEYLDTDLGSATVRETTRPEGGDEFVFEVHTNDDQLTREVSQRLGATDETDQEDS